MTVLAMELVDIAVPVVTNLRGRARYDALAEVAGPAEGHGLADEEEQDRTGELHCCAAATKQLGYSS